MKKNKSITKGVCLLLALLMLFGSVQTAFAEEPQEAVSETQQEALPAEGAESISAGTEKTAPGSETETIPGSETETEEVPVEEPKKPVEVSLSGGECKLDIGPAVTGEGDVIQAAVWSEADGQDDLIWYDCTPVGGNRFEKTVRLADHKGTGLYHVHVYNRTAAGKLELVGVNSFTVEGITRGTLEVTDLRVKEGKADVRLTGASAGSGLVSVSVAVWSDAKQADIKWYDAAAQADGSWTFTMDVRNHQNNRARYLLHSYARDNAGNNEFTGAAAADFSLKAGTVTTVADTDKGSYTITIEGFDAPQGVTEVQAAVWTEEGGQDDLSWNTFRKEGADYVYTGSLSSLKHTGKVLIHIYVSLEGGKKAFLAYSGFSIDPASCTGVEAAADTEAGTYTITVKDFVSALPVREVRAAVWTENGGQDDLSWNTMKKKGNDYVFTGSLDSLKHTGHVIIHVYLTLADGRSAFLEYGAFDIEGPSASGMEVVTNNAAGTFTIRVNGFTAALPVKEMRAAVWHSPDQSDILWYSMKDKGDGTWTAENGNLKNHKYHTGQYNVHVYIYLKNGVSDFLCKDTFAMEKKCDSAFTVTDLHAGTPGEEQKRYRIAVGNVEIPGGAKDVRFALWNSEYFPGMIWHTAVRDGSTYYIDANIADYKRLGKYTCHVYYTAMDGSSVFLMGGECLNIDGVPAGSAEAQLTDASAGTFDVVITDVSAPSGISSVRAAIWTDESGDNRYWYTAEKQADGTYRACCSIADNNYGLGHYYIHVYATMGNGIEAFVDSTALDFNPSDFVYVKKNGAFSNTVGIRNPHAAPTTAYVWHRSDQSDMRTFSFTANGANHYVSAVNMGGFSDTGEYIVHIYSGSEFLGASTFTWESVWRYENGYKFLYINGVKQTNLTDFINSGLISGPYRIDINRTCCTITVYARDGGNGYIIPVIAMTCSVGVMTPELETPTGDYQTHFKQRWRQLMGPSYGQYVTCIMPNYGIHFHSVAGYRMSSHNLSYTDYNMLGQPASHGCVRLCVRDAKWIYDYMPVGTWVHIYDSSYPGPFGKPATIKITPVMDYDPTDPNL